MSGMEYEATEVSLVQATSETLDTSQVFGFCQMDLPENFSQSCYLLQSIEEIRTFEIEILIWQMFIVLFLTRLCGVRIPFFRWLVRQVSHSERFRGAEIHF